MKKEYILESLSNTLFDMGLNGLFDVEQLESIAESLDISLDNYSMACGYDAIPNPLQSEISRLKDNIETERENQKSLEREHDNQIAYLNSEWRSKVRDLEEQIVAIRAGRRF